MAKSNLDIGLEFVEKAHLLRKNGEYENSLNAFKQGIDAFVRDLKTRQEGSKDYTRIKQMTDQILVDAEAVQIEMKARLNAAQVQNQSNTSLSNIFSSLFSFPSASKPPTQQEIQSIPDNYNYYKAPEVKVNPSTNFASPVGTFIPKNPPKTNVNTGGAYNNSNNNNKNSSNNNSGSNSNSTSPRGIGGGNSNNTSPRGIGGSTGGGGTNAKGPAVTTKPGDPAAKTDEYETRILSELLETNPNVLFSDIAGLQFPIQILKEAVVLPNLRPDIFTGLRAPPRGVLLYGPPGTGKTLLAKAVATESGFSFFSITSSSISSKYHGEGEKLVKALFSVATTKQPAVIFMDEIDSILSARSESEHEASRRVKTEFMTQVDGATSNSETRLLIMGATNIPWELDEAVLRRFVKRICIPLPDKTTRTVLIKKLLDKQQNDSSSSKGGIFSVLRGSHTCSELISSHQLEVLATSTEGYSASDITALIKEAAMGPIRSLTPEELVKIRTSDVRPINGDDINSALKVIRPSVSADSLKGYEEWTQKYGSER